MKYLYPLALILLLVSCQKEEKKAIDRTKTDWAFYKLKGDVKSLSTKSWLVNDKLEKVKPQHEDMSIHDSDITFGNDGMQAGDKFYHNNGPYEETTYKGRERKQQTLQYLNNAVGIKIDYKWDKTGKNNTSITRRNPDNTQIDRIEMKYQGNKLAEKITFSAQNNPTDKVTYLYDSKGNVNQENIYLASEYVQYTAIYKYDKQNRKVSEARYDKDSKMLYETRSVYEGKNLVKKETTNTKGESEYSEKFTYNEKGNMLTHFITEKFDNSKTMNKYQYDAKGNKTGWLVIKNEVPVMKAAMTYDNKGNLTSYVVNEAGNGKVLDQREYTYEYDTKGNWTKKVTIVNGKPQFIAERQVSYFDEE